MPRYKKGDIVVCVTDKMYGMTLKNWKYSLKVGEQYQVDDFIEMAEKNLVSVNKLNGEPFSIFDDKHFIPLDIWREFQLRKLLD
jgi:hypothetical protein